MTKKTVVLTDGVEVTDNVNFTDSNCNENISVKDYKTDIGKQMEQGDQEEDEIHIISGVNIIEGDDKPDDNNEVPNSTNAEELSSAY